jgi:glutathione S-transferase
MGKVPALVHGQTVVTEGAAICVYLADAFPEAELAPPIHDRAAYYRWIFFAAGPLEHAWTNKSFGFDLPEKGEMRAGYGSLERVLDVLEDAVSHGDYIAGGRFSAADVYVGSQIGFGLRFGMFDKRPVLQRYWDRLSVRPALARANALDEAPAPGE